MRLQSYLKANFFNETINWTEYPLGEHMIFSPRDTVYTAATFPRSMHFHDYYEIVVYLSGDVRYVSENESLLTPETGDAVVNAPARLHTASMTGEQTRYARHVLYLYPDALDMMGGGALLDFLTAGRYCIRLPEKQKLEMLRLFSRMRDALAENVPGARALALGYAARVFSLLNEGEGARAPGPGREDAFPPAVEEIRRYIDAHFAEINTVGDVAAHFFYSREYISRLFRRYLNTTVSDYLLKRRVAHCRQLMTGGLPLIEVGMRAGFGSVSSFIRAFESVTGMPPSRYRRAQENMYTEAESK